METITRSEFDAFKDSLEEKNTKMMELILQLKEDIKKIATRQRGVENPLFEYQSTSLERSTVDQERFTSMEQMSQVYNKGEFII